MIKRNETVNETTQEVNSDLVNQTPTEEVAKVETPKSAPQRRITTVVKSTTTPKVVSPRKTTTPKNSKLNTIKNKPSMGGGQLQEEKLNC
jgi:hypothetical protein